MKRICKHCQKEFEAIRETSKYCSANCRLLAFRLEPVSVSKKDQVSVAKDENETLKDSVATQEPVSVSTPKIVGRNGYYLGQVLTNRIFDGVKWPDRTVGICRDCGKEIDREKNPEWDLLDKCPYCSWKKQEQLGD